MVRELGVWAFRAAEGRTLELLGLLIARCTRGEPSGGDAPDLAPDGYAGAAVR